MVSPAFGKRSLKVVKSIFALPTTAIRGRLLIGRPSLVSALDCCQWNFLTGKGAHHRVTESQRKHYCFFSVSLSLCGEKNFDDRLLAVGYPDILYLGGVLEEPSTFALFHVEPVN